MKVMYIAYWGQADGLTSATVIPHLKILGRFDNIESIAFCTIERDGKNYTDVGLPKVTHFPLHSKNLPLGLFNKFSDFLQFPEQLKAIAKEIGIEKVICRGAMAGALGYLLHTKTKIPFIVESYEPHADYMLESGVWSRFGMRFLFQSYWEQKEKQTAKTLITVSHNYKNQLLKEGIPEQNLQVIPCCTQLDQFQFSKSNRQKMREKLNLQDEVVGVYVGKFGGIYLDNKAFEIFQAAFKHYADRFFLIILTPEDHNMVNEKLTRVGIDLKHAYVNTVPHKEVPEYLSTADFAFSTIKPSPSRKYCSPVKDGEYWANGLPILLTEGVGDDSHIVQQENAGVVISLEASELTDSFKTIDTILAEKNHRQRIIEVARKHRSFSVAEQVYNKLFKDK